MRIASLAPSVTEILFELGAQNEIVCSTIFCDYPETAKSLPKVGSWVNIEPQRLSEFQPDIVFTSSAVQGKFTIQLKELGFNVININPLTLSEVVESYNQIGSLVGKKSEAAAIVNELYKKIMGCYLRESFSYTPRVYCEEWSSPPMAAGNWVPEIVKLAGGIPGIGQTGKLSRQFELQELVDFNPEVIVLHLCGMGEKVDKQSIKTRPGWENVEAVKADRIHVLDDSLLNRPTSRLFSGLDTLRQTFGSFRYQDH